MLEGWIITYVDNLLSISAEHYGLEVLQAVAEIWKCSDIETLSLTTEITSGTQDQTHKQGNLSPSETLYN